MKKKGKIVITYGTFDLLHEGHINILKRAKALGDYLIVGVTSERYDLQRGKLNVRQSLAERIKNIEQTGLADKIIVEEYEGQKIDDILRYNVDIFVIGSDWKGKFDYLKKYCKVVYLERTKGISSTKLRGIVNIGIVGSGRIAERFVSEAKYVSGVNVDWVYNPHKESALKFARKKDLLLGTDVWEEFIDSVDAVYIASPHETHYGYAKKSLMEGKHVLCEKPLTLKVSEARELFQIARDKGLVLMEAIKTAYTPAFKRIVNLALSGRIGDVKYIDATFTKLVSGAIRELDPERFGGSVTELSSYVLLPMVKILGLNFEEIQFFTYKKSLEDVDLWTGIIVKTKAGMGMGKVGLGVKSEGELVISGTTGYIYVPAPWWKPNCFEIRRENMAENEKFCEPYLGEGLRYEIAEFVKSINEKNTNVRSLAPEESIKIVEVIESFLNNKNLKIIL